MFRLFSTSKFWYIYLSLAAMCFVAAITISNVLGLGGQDINETQYPDAWYLVLGLLLPLAPIPFFALIGFLQRLKK